MKDLMTKLNESFFNKRINTKKLRNILKKTSFRIFKNTSSEKFNKIKLIVLSTIKFSQISKFIKINSSRSNQFELNKRTLNLTNYFRKSFYKRFKEFKKSNKVSTLFSSMLTIITTVVQIIMNSKFQVSDFINFSKERKHKDSSKLKNVSEKHKPFLKRRI